MSIEYSKEDTVVALLLFQCDRNDVDVCTLLYLHMNMTRTYMDYNNNMF